MGMLLDVPARRHGGQQWLTLRCAKTNGAVKPETATASPHQKICGGKRISLNLPGREMSVESLYRIRRPAMRMREDFEKWADANWMIVHSQDDAWECWQAATIQAAERIKEEAAKACESDE